MTCLSPGIGVRDRPPIADPDRRAHGAPRTIAHPGLAAIVLPPSPRRRAGRPHRPLMSSQPLGADTVVVLRDELGEQP
ncbi:hypothetical protein [Novosphingobium aerophilum]|uniref:Uncharacterized protein n=1 Tax=Novosphingobium aerophilum TaxID=2839843 RepID=A0A7X1KAF2_9SPHN|nr:hypothetical protein [Novosphingobium aerophilum]MBC2650118.1 hypothetical protein [Novosphingobium aerophilum]